MRLYYLRAEYGHNNRIVHFFCFSSCHIIHRHYVQLLSKIYFYIRMFFHNNTLAKICQWFFIITLATSHTSQLATLKKNSAFLLSSFLIIIFIIVVIFITFWKRCDFNLDFFYSSFINLENRELDVFKFNLVHLTVFW